LLVPLVILVVLPLAVICAFVSLAVTGHALDLSALISLLMFGGPKAQVPRCAPPFSSASRAAP
jgi:multidrug efflux pump subunit AcrB